MGSAPNPTQEGRSWSSEDTEERALYQDGEEFPGQQAGGKVLKTQEIARRK